MHLLRYNCTNVSAGATSRGEERAAKDRSNKRPILFLGGLTTLSVYITLRFRLSNIIACTVTTVFAVIYLY